ncbi:MAG: DUF4493 domain-containing protein [Muribaculaceae bacterium]|nr:DUF4493 domain-containing protein [Muribaculaceae bacterium]
MNKIYKLMLGSLAALLSFTACDDPNYPGQESGEGQLSMKSLLVNVISIEDVIESRSTADVSNYTVDIVNKTTGNIAYTWKYSEMPAVVTLKVGDYTVRAYNTQVQTAAWETPYYYADKDVTITKNEIAELGTLTCKLSNVKVSIRYSDALKALIGSGNDVKVNVIVGETGSLDFAYNETRSGYFKYVESSTTLVATFTGTVNGYYMNEYKVLADVAPGQHRIITFGVKDSPVPPDETGLIGTTGLALDSYVTSVDMTVDVPIEEETVDPDDMLKLSNNALKFTSAAASKNVVVTATSQWTASTTADWITLSATSGAAGETTVTVTTLENTTESQRSATVTFNMGSMTQTLVVTQDPKADETAPTITSETLDLENINVITDGMQAIVFITAPNGIQNLNVTIDSPTLTPEELESVGLRSNFDLANPGDLESALSGLGFPTGSQVAGSTETITFDISQFMVLLKKFEGVHKFILEVVDVKGQSTEVTLKFEAE